MKLFGGEAPSFPNACTPLNWSRRCSESSQRNVSDASMVTADLCRDSLLWGRSNHSPLLTFNYGSDAPPKPPASVKKCNGQQVRLKHSTGSTSLAGEES
jgi:hypothetical protein